MKKMRALLTGVPGVPMLTHNERLSVVSDPIARQMKAISSKRSKTDDDLEEMARLEFEGGLYLAPDGTVGVPSWNVFRCIQEGAKLNKLGKAVERSIVMTGADIVPIMYPGPNTPDAMFRGGHYDQRQVKIGTSKVTRTRPCFSNWEVEVEFAVNTEVLRIEDLDMVFRNAGQMCGLGDYRPRFGRFEVELSEV